MNQYSLILSFFFSVIILSDLTPSQLCSSTSIDCSSQPSFQTHFPFRIPEFENTTRCGYPGFELSCSSNGSTILSLPSLSQPLRVENISYEHQYILLSDPNLCTPKWAMDLYLVSTLFIVEPSNTFNDEPRYYAFVNCSGPPLMNDAVPFGSSVISCMSGGDYTIVATLRNDAEKIMVDKGCEVVKRMSEMEFWWEGKMMNDVENYPQDFSQVFLLLSWDEPDCSACTSNGSLCGFAADSGLDVACYNAGAFADGIIPTHSKWDYLVLDIVFPVSMLIVLLSILIVCCNPNTNTESSRYEFPQQMLPRLGLDESIIESYPKTVLGESKRLPNNLGDNICSICLSEYEAKEILRTIPECQHFFHADCIDEWFRMHTTCPMCRNSPQPSPALAA